MEHPKPPTIAKVDPEYFAVYYHSMLLKLGDLSALNETEDSTFFGLMSATLCIHRAMQMEFDDFTDPATDMSLRFYAFGGLSYDHLAALGSELFNDGDALVRPCEDNLIEIHVSAVAAAAICAIEYDHPPRVDFDSYRTAVREIRADTSLFNEDDDADDIGAQIEQVVATANEIENDHQAVFGGWMPRRPGLGKIVFEGLTSKMEH